MNIFKRNFTFLRQNKNLTVTIELKNIESKNVDTEDGSDLKNVKLKEIIIVMLIISVWFYSLYRYKILIFFFYQISYTIFLKDSSKFGETF